MWLRLRSVTGLRKANSSWVNLPQPLLKEGWQLGIKKNYIFKSFTNTYQKSQIIYIYGSNVYVILHLFEIKIMNGFLNLWGFGRWVLDCSLGIESLLLVYHLTNGIRFGCLIELAFCVWCCGFLPLMDWLLWFLSYR